MITYLALGVFLAGAVALAAVFILASQVARRGPTPYPEVAGRAYRIDSCRSFVRWPGCF